MSDVPSKKFLQLIKVSFDVSTGVVRDFAENNILGLPEYGGSFIKFLDLRKHEIYHKWQNHTPCCYCVNDLNPCPKENVKRKFYMLYQTISDRQVVCVKGKCPVKVNGCIKQYCICNIIPHQTLSLNEIDISMLSFLLQDCNITQLQLENIQNLYKQRCRLCHAYSTHCFSNDDYEDIWTNLEISTLELAKDVNHYYHKQSKEHLKTLKSHDFTPEEHSKLLSRIFHELSVLQNTNNGIIKNGFTKCGSKIAEVKEEIIKNTDTKFAEMTEHIQQLTAKVNVLLSQKTSRTRSPNTANEEHKETSMHDNGEASNADLFVQQGAKPKQKPEGIRHVRAICHVEGKELDELSAVQTLTEDKHNLPSDLCFDIITVEQKCLLLQLAVPSKVLEDKNSFRMALRTLILQIARAGKIDINKPNIITLNLRFEEGLTEENMRVIQELSSISVLSKMVDEKLTYQQEPILDITRGRTIKQPCMNCKNLEFELVNKQNQNDLLLARMNDLTLENDSLHTKCVSLETETDRLMTEACELFEELSLHRRRILADQNTFSKLAADTVVSQNIEIGREPVEKSHVEREAEEASYVDIGRTTEEMFPFMNRRRTVPAHRIVNRRERRRESQRDSGSESMDEYGGTVSDDESGVQIRW